MKSFFILLMSVFISCDFNNDTQRVIDLWNSGKNEEASALATELCLREEINSCKLTMLAKVEKFIDDESKAKLLIKYKKFKNDEYFKMDHRLHVREKGLLVEVVESLAEQELKYLKNQDLMYLFLMLSIYESKLKPAEESTLYKKTKKALAAEMILRNHRFGYYVQGRSYLREGNDVNAFSSFLNGARRGDTKSIRQVYLGYAVGKGRVSDFNEARAWLDLCIMIGDDTCVEDKKMFDDDFALSSYSVKKVKELAKVHQKGILKEIELKDKCEENYKLYCDDKICDQYCSYNDYVIGKRE